MAVFSDWYPIRKEDNIKKNYPGLIGLLKQTQPQSFNESIKIFEAYRNKMKVPDASYEFTDQIPEIYLNYLWQANRIIYQFNNELAQALADQATSSDFGEQLPTELLYNLPYPCISFRFEEMSLLVHSENGDSALTFSGWCTLTSTKQADFLYDFPVLFTLWESMDKTQEYRYVLPLLPNKTIKDDIEALHTDWLENGAIEVPSLDNSKPEIIMALLAVQAILYLQAENADISSRPTVKHTKSKKKNIKTDTPKIVDVGYHISAALKQSTNRLNISASDERRNIQGSLKRPHTRRGHWHRYWTGPINGERKIVIKWIAPTMIHPEGIDEKPTLIPVK